MEIGETQFMTSISERCIGNVILSGALFAGETARGTQVEPHTFGASSREEVFPQFIPDEPPCRGRIFVGHLPRRGGSVGHGVRRHAAVGGLRQRLLTRQPGRPEQLAPGVRPMHREVRTVPWAWPATPTEPTSMAAVNFRQGTAAKAASSRVSSLRIEAVPEPGRIGRFAVAVGGIRILGMRRRLAA